MFIKIIDFIDYEDKKFCKEMKRISDCLLFIKFSNVSNNETGAINSK